MSNAFMAGMRSAALGGQNVRSADLRSQDQAASQSGNPMTPNNVRAVRPMGPMQMQRPAIPTPKQYIPPQPGTVQTVDANNQAMWQAQQQGQQQGVPNANLMGQMQAPQWNTPGNMQQAPVQTMPVQQQGPMAMSGNGNGFVTNLNRGRFGYNRPLWQ